jgi:hypothetical protein
VTLALLSLGWGCGGASDAVASTLEPPAVADRGSLGPIASVPAAPSVAPVADTPTPSDRASASGALAAVPVAAPSSPPDTAPAAVAAVVDPSPRPDDCAAEVDGLELADATDPRLDGSRLIVVRKAARRLAVYSDRRKVACYSIGLGFSPKGHKKVEGDGRTPEGWYRTSDKPWSSFDNAIAIHYPNADDAIAAAEDGRISARTRDRIVSDLRARRVPPQSTKLGGAVLIHGGGSSTDWTLGCVALDDDDLLDLRRVIAHGMRTDLLVLP